MLFLKLLCLALLPCLCGCAYAESAAYVSACTAELYEEPSLLSSCRNILSYGEGLTLHEQQGLWAHVETMDGRSGYCMLGALTPNDPNALDLQLTALCDVAATRTPRDSSMKLAEIPAGTEVHVVALCAGNEYLRIELEGDYAYVPAEGFDLPLAICDQLCWIHSDIRVNVYAEPDFWTAPIASLSHGERFTYLACLDTDWGDYAWIRMENGQLGHISQIETISLVDPNTFNFPMYAAISGKLLCTQTLNPENATVSIAKGDEVTVVAVTPDCCYIRLRYHGEYYYARTCFFSAQPNDEPLLLCAADETDVYMDDSLNPYQESVWIPAPYFDEPTGEMTHPSNILRTLAAGETVEVLGLSEQNNGLVVQCSDGAIGYCHFYGLIANPKAF